MISRARRRDSSVGRLLQHRDRAVTAFRDCAAVAHLARNSSLARSPARLRGASCCSRGGLVPTRAAAPRSMALPCGNASATSCTRDLAGLGLGRIAPLGERMGRLAQRPTGRSMAPPEEQRQQAGQHHRQGGRAHQQQRRAAQRRVAMRQGFGRHASQPQRTERLWAGTSPTPSSVLRAEGRPVIFHACAEHAPRGMLARLLSLLRVRAMMTPSCRAAS